MNIAYIILAHRFPEQLARLVGRLAAPATSFFVHVDSSVDGETYGTMVAGLRGRPNVYFLPRHRSAWGRWGNIAATLEGLEQVIRARLLPDYVILLSGQDYPLRTPTEIAAFLAGHRGTSFIDTRELPDYTWNWHGSLDRFHGHPLPAGMRPFGGSQWWALSGDCAAYVKGAADAGRDLIQLFEQTQSPSEHFFQTVIGNSPFRDRLARVKTETVLGVHYIDWHRGTPKVLDSEDFERLMASPALFARKFDMTHDRAIFDMIDARLTERMAQDEQSVASYPLTDSGAVAHTGEPERA